MAEILGAVSSIATLIELSFKVSRYLVSVKDGSKDRDRLRQELSSIAGLLFFMKDQATLALAGEDPAISSTLEVLMGPQGPIAQFQQSLDILESKLAGGKIGKAIIWPFRKDEVKDILARLERQKSLFVLAQQNDQVHLSQAIRSDIANLNQVTLRVDTKLSDLARDHTLLQESHRTQQDALRKQSVLDWLSLINFRSQQNDLYSKCQPGSGQWLLESEVFKNWINRHGAVLHGKGIPGAGKTFLASKVIHHLEAQTSAPKATIVYVYCNYQESHIQTLDNLLASILGQMVQRMTNVPPELDALYGTHMINKTRPTKAELQPIMQSICEQGKRTYLVLDALDEYQDSRTIITMLDQLQQYGFNLLITSRPNVSLVEYLNDVVVEEIRANDDDVRLYLKARLPALQCIKTRLEIQTVVVDEILRAADGMFLLVRLHFDSLLDRASPKAIKMALQEIPKGTTALTSIYDSVMARIYDQTPYARDQAIKVLSWLFFSVRALSVEELCYALAIEPGSDAFDHDNLSNIEDLVAVCKGLVSVHQESEMVRLSHYTLQEYFLQTAARYLQDGELTIASSCLTCLSYKNTSFYTKGEKSPGSGGYKDSSDFTLQISDTKSQKKDIISKCDAEQCPSLLLLEPLFLYASKYWGHHALHVQNEVKELALRFLALGPNVRTAYSVMNEYDYPTRDGRHTLIQGAHLCAFFDLDILFPALLHLYGNPDVRDHCDRTPLIWAVMGGSLSVIRLLMELPEVDFNSSSSEDYYYSSQIAFDGIRRKGNSRRTDYDRAFLSSDGSISHTSAATPLMIAIFMGNHEVTKILLQHKDVDVNLQDSLNRSPLAIAAGQGFTDIVDLLLGHPKIDVNARDDSNHTALSYAVRGCHGLVLQSLLARKDIKLDYSYEVDHSLLQDATRRGSYEVLDALLTKTDILSYTQPEHKRDILSYAAEGGFPTMVKQALLQEKVDINAQDGCGTTALMYAADGGHEAVVKQLLSMQAIQVNLTDCLGRTALVLAAGNGHDKIVSLLLKSEEIDPNAVDDLGWRPLSIAADAGSLSTVNILLSHRRIDLNRKDDGGQALLHWVAENRTDVPIVQAFLAREDIDVELLRDDGKTPLILAAWSDERLATVQLLVAHPGVNPVARDNFGWTALDYALVLKQFENIKVFLSLEAFKPLIQKWVREDGYLYTEDIVPKFEKQRYQIMKFTVTFDEYTLYTGNDL
ncbi:uncharacterized protein KY384_008879 [Bacidia gigantensis]|uniref:uncharacterized protein n=1 Tax=Bacidia gigantensis TaxID=2732470 RepID=UPI001D041601|nr:uncharacterized protein KY384_008879 [Bacidia gigantensis]KAG8525235.1 hypothetical protein KY384_008879 [Bacidia gigantensis]